VLSSVKPGTQPRIYARRSTYFADLRPKAGLTVRWPIEPDSEQRSLLTAHGSGWCAIFGLVSAKRTRWADVVCWWRNAKRGNLSPILTTASIICTCGPYRYIVAILTGPDNS
jgi:hypothetical protein